MDKDHEFKRVGYDDWEIRICLAPTTDEGQIAGHADLSLGSEHKCRIALSGHFEDLGSACDALEGKARSWIDDWTMRPHSGETDFAEL